MALDAVRGGGFAFLEHSEEILPIHQCSSSQPKRFSQKESTFDCPSQGGTCLAFRGLISGIANIHGVFTEDCEGAAQFHKNRASGLQIDEKSQQVVSSWDVEASFFKQSLQILLDALLTMKTNQIVQAAFIRMELGSSAKIVLRFADPLTRRLSHKALFRA